MTMVLVRVAMHTHIMVGVFSPPFSLLSAAVPPVLPRLGSIESIVCARFRNHSVS